MPRSEPVASDVKLGRLAACIAAIQTEPGPCVEFPPCGQYVERLFESARMLVEGPSRYHNEPKTLLGAVLVAAFNAQFVDDEDVLIGVERLLNAELAEMNRRHH